MIDGGLYLSLVESFFMFLESEYEMIICERMIRSNVFYVIRYCDSVKEVSISYENIEDYLQVHVRVQENCDSQNHGKKMKTFRLDSLIGVVVPEITKERLSSNNEFFREHAATNPLERKLLKKAKELRLLLAFNDESCTP